MTTLLIAIHVIACIVLILVVLLQAGRGADMGAAFGGASTPMFGSGSSTNPLARMTTIMAVLFLTSALFLAVASARRASVFDSTPEPLVPPPASAPVASPSASDTPPPAAAPVGEAQPLTIPATPTPAAPSAPAPAAPEGGAAPAPADSAPAAAPDAAPATPPAAAPATPPAASAPSEPVATPPATPPAAAPPADAPAATPPAH